MTFKNSFRSGDHFVQCDRSGFKVRVSTTKKEWHGRIVREVDFETRHPQDFVKGRRDRQNPPFAIPEPTDDFLTANEVTKDSF